MEARNDRAHHNHHNDQNCARGASAERGAWVAQTEEIFGCQSTHVLKLLLLVGLLTIL